MSKNTEQGLRIGSPRMAAITQAAASSQPLVKFFDWVPEEKASLVTRMVDAATKIAAAAPSEGHFDDGDPLMVALAELGAMPWSQRPARPRTQSPRRYYPPLGLSRKEAEQATTGTPTYPHVVLDGDSLDGNAIALVAAVTSALRDAGIPENEISNISSEALSKDYSHVLRTITGSVSINWRTDRRRPPTRERARAKVKAPSAVANLPKLPTQAAQPFLPIMYDRWEPPCLDGFLHQLRPREAMPSARQKAASKKTFRVVKLDDLDETALASFPVLRALRSELGQAGLLGQIADLLYGGDEPATFISARIEALDEIVERVGTKSAVEIAMAYTPDDDAVWVDTTEGGRSVGLLVYRSHPGWVHLRRLEFDETGALRCLPVGIVRTQTHDGEALDWQALENGTQTSDQATDRAAALALYHQTSSEVIQPGIDRDAAEPFYGVRCLDLIRVAVATSPLCA